jgi:hypothetical protein
MSEQRSDRARTLRALARRAARTSYAATKRVAIMRMSREAAPPIVVFSMGKTGSTALAKAIGDATGRRVFQVFRLDEDALAAAERRYRATYRERTLAASSAPFPGAQHLWESEYLLSHPPTASKPWTVVTSVREPVAQAVSAFFHARGQRGRVDDLDLATLRADFVAGGWVKRPLRWFDREFAAAFGVDVYSHAFDANVGQGLISTPALEVLIVRQENLAEAADALGRFVGLAGPLPLRTRNDASTKPYGATYRAFEREARLPASLLDRAYDSRYARHFYTSAEIGRYREIWGGDTPAAGARD